MSFWSVFIVCRDVIQLLVLPPPSFLIKTMWHLYFASYAMTLVFLNFCYKVAFKKALLTSENFLCWFWRIILHHVCLKLFFPSSLVVHVLFNFHSTPSSFSLVWSSVLQRGWFWEFIGAGLLQPHQTFLPWAWYCYWLKPLPVTQIALPSFQSMPIVSFEVILFSGPSDAASLPLLLHWHWYHAHLVAVGGLYPPTCILESVGIISHLFFFISIVHRF